MTDDDFVNLERALWLEGAQRFRTAMAGACLMVFPEPVGILRDEAILQGLAAAPRWSEVALSDVEVARPEDGAAILAYRTEARRGEGLPYRALCTSTWLGQRGEWRIAAHQHTPLA